MVKGKKQIQHHLYLLNQMCHSHENRRRPFERIIVLFAIEKSYIEHIGAISKTVYNILKG